MALSSAHTTGDIIVEYYSAIWIQYLSLATPGFLAPTLRGRSIEREVILLDNQVRALFVPVQLGRETERVVDRWSLLTTTKCQLFPGDLMFVVTGAICSAFLDPVYCSN